MLLHYTVARVIWRKYSCQKKFAMETIKPRERRYLKEWRSIGYVRATEKFQRQNMYYSFPKSHVSPLKTSAR